MKKDTKSALRIKTVIGGTAFLIVVATSTQVLNLVKNNTQESIKQIEPIEQTAQISQLKQEEITTVDYTRDFEITSRSIVNRLNNNEQQVEEKKYISIEEIKISKDMDLSVRCGVSKEDFKTLMGSLKQDTTKFFYDNADTIYDLCEKYEINEIFFCGLIAGESGWKIASNHRNTCNYMSLMSGGRLIRYSTPEEGLEAAAKLLHKNYLTEGGAYYNGKTIYGVQKCYCPESTWVGLIYGCMKQIIK